MFGNLNVTIFYRDFQTEKVRNAGYGISTSLINEDENEGGELTINS